MRRHAMSITENLARAQLFFGPTGLFPIFLVGTDAVGVQKVVATVLGGLDSFGDNELPNSLRRDAEVLGSVFGRHVVSHRSSYTAATLRMGSRSRPPASGIDSPKPVDRPDFRPSRPDGSPKAPVASPRRADSCPKRPHSCPKPTDCTTMNPDSRTAERECRTKLPDRRTNRWP